ncbi:MAG: MFS transporter [Gammaproteobacteria bacterium]|nr:MFS transporter [Gammaproteobacteria bacterium]
MRQVLLSVAALIISTAVLLAGNSLQFVILGLRADAEGFSLTSIGAMTAAYYVGYAVGTLRAPELVAAIGHIRAFAALGSLTSGVVLAHALWVDPVFWSVLRVLTGLCFAGLATVVESWMNGRATREIRGRLLAVLSMAAIGGYAVGPLFATLASVDGRGTPGEND